jgi:hypothetical protein
MRLVPAIIRSALFGLFIATALWADVARAEVVISADVDANTSPNGIDYAKAGPGLGLRLGLRTPIGEFRGEPELTFAYAFFRRDPSDLGTKPALYRGSAGVRVAYGSTFRPGVSLHLGLAHATAPVSYSMGDVEYSRQVANTTMTTDLGAFFDVSVPKNVDVGAHGAYTYKLAGSSSSAFGWFSLGVHIALVF